jgi:starvation-inducible DNA-binding protein
MNAGQLLRRATMHRTRNDLPLRTRTAMVELLNARLADALDLAAQAKQAHWNVRGENFIALHELFDKLHDAASEAVDEIAERAVALGGIARGTVQTVSKATTLRPYPETVSESRAHVEALANAFAAFGKAVRKATDVADDAGDADTADLFTGISRDADKYLWMLEAHL